MIISGPRIYTEQGIIKNAALQIKKNKIDAINSLTNFPTNEVVTFPESYHLVPGFIDIHLHGLNSFDVMDGNFTALQKISETLVRFGTTAYLATTMTAPIAKLEEVLERTGDYIQKQNEGLGAHILGIHLEGPFLSPTKVGAHAKDYLLTPHNHYILEWQKKSAQNIKVVTIAPELLNSLEFISFLKSQNIIASIGHSDATYSETIAAISKGCGHVTHLFNAMRGIHQREPGVVTAALLSDNLFVELIVDGIHLHPAMVELVLKLKKDKIILVTDSMRATCLADGIYDLGGQKVEVANNRAQLPDGTLAGSVLTLNQALKNMQQFTQCELSDIVRFVSENPAKLLNIFDKKGSIAIGKDADLVVLDENLQVVWTMVSGRVVYSLCVPT